LSCASHIDGQRVLVVKNLSTLLSYVWLATIGLDTTSYVILLSPQLRNIIRALLNL
jgi:hypothetical protein